LQRDLVLQAQGLYASDDFRFRGSALAGSLKFCALCLLMPLGAILVLRLVVWFEYSWNILLNFFSAV